MRWEWEPVLLLPPRLLLLLLLSRLLLHLPRLPLCLWDPLQEPTLAPTDNASAFATWLWGMGNVLGNLSNKTVFQMLRFKVLVRLVVQLVKFNVHLLYIMSNQ